MSVPRHTLWQRIKKERVSYLMLLPNVIMFTVFTIYPLLWVLRYMFYEYRGYGEPVFIGLENFARVFRDTVFWHAVVNTFIYVFGKLIFTIPIAFLLAFLLQKNTRFNAVSQSIVFTPTIMSQAVMALIFYLLFNTYNGEINHILVSLGIIDQNINWLGIQLAMVTVIILAVWGGVGNYMVYFIAGLTGISTDVYESARLDGANSVQTLFRITLPLLAPVLKMILMLALVISFYDMQSIMVLTEGGPMNATNVMFLYIYQLFFPISAGSTVIQEFGYGAAASLIAAGIVGIFTGTYLILAKRLDKITEG
ncbi:MAG: sugar ABC transporter permease [Eubacteriales bacterium]|nr:sugar ABC transporter permease [Eubacteriales bacterium]